MSRIQGEHFSESIKFEADGLEDILRLIRETKVETDQLHTSQTRSASIFQRLGISGRMGGEGGAPAVVRGELSQITSLGAQAAAASRAEMARRLGRPVGAATVTPASAGSTYGFLKEYSYAPVADSASVAAQQRAERRKLADRIVAEQRRPEKATPLPEQGIASWERMKRNAEQYMQVLKKVEDQYKRLRSGASDWFNGDPMTRRMRESGQRALQAAREEQKATERQRRRAIGFRGRFAEDWEGEGGYRSRLGRAGGFLGNAAVGAGTLAFGMGMIGLQGTVTGNRFNNEVQRTQMEMGNAFGPALREATHWLQKFNEWLSKLSPQGQKLVMYGGLAAAGYAGARALGMGGMIHGAAGALGNAAMSGAVAYGPGALRAGAAGLRGLGGGSLLMGGAIAGVSAYGMYNAFAEQSSTRQTADLIKRIREGKLDEKEAAAIPENLKLAYQRAGGRDKFLEQTERERQEIARRMYGEDAQGNKLGGWARFKAGFNDLRTFAGLGGDLGERREKLKQDLALVDADREIQAKGKLEVGGAKHNTEPLAGGGFEGLLQTYQRTETAFGKVDPGEKEQKMLGAIEKLVLAIAELGKKIEEDKNPMGGVEEKAAKMVAAAGAALG